jgi:hypothetical protein
MDALDDYIIVDYANSTVEKLSAEPRLCVQRTQREREREIF